MGDKDTTTSGEKIRPPRDGLYRGLRPGPELRAVGADMPLMVVKFSVFDQWTEINSIFEGRFLERVAQGSFTKTFKENRDQMRALFQHGHDPQVGDKPMGPIEELREDPDAAVGDVPLLDTFYNREILPGLEADVYGASFRFRVTREEFNKKPEKSAYNPEALPERTIREVELMEFGPVTFPAYLGTSVGVRSLTDHFVMYKYAKEPERLLEVLREAVQQKEERQEPAPSTPDAGETHLGQERRDTPRRNRTDYLQRRSEPWRLTSSPR